MPYNRPSATSIPISTYVHTDLSDVQLRHELERHRR
jgi:hypothetical protein